MLLHGNGLCMLIKSDESLHAHIQTTLVCILVNYILIFH
jgi:hypothetical protein